MLNLQRKYKSWKAGIDRYERTRPDRLVPVENTIPCVFHMYSRITEKKLLMLLKVGYSRRKTASKKEQYIINIENTVNQVTIGSEHSKTNFSVPLTDDKSNVLDISLSDGQAKLIMSNIDLILAETFDDDSEESELMCAEWTNAFTLFQDVNKMHQCRTVFSDAMIDEYNKKSYKFFTLWLKLTGSAGVTNYFHHIISGHMRYFLIKYRNFYMYSQQGWEHLNKRANGIYHQHSQKGGNGSKEEDRSHILPVFRFFARTFMWITGLGAEYFAPK